MEIPIRIDKRHGTTATEEARGTPAEAHGKNPSVARPEHPSFNHDPHSSFFGYRSCLPCYCTARCYSVLAQKAKNWVEMGGWVGGRVAVVVVVVLSCCSSLERDDGVGGRRDWRSKKKHEDKNKNFQTGGKRLGQQTRRPEPRLPPLAYLLVEARLVLILTLPDAEDGLQPAVENLVHLHSMTIPFDCIAEWGCEY